MAKGPIVTEHVQFLIASIYQKHPKWKAPEVRNEVSFLMRKSNPKLPSSWPSLSSVQKVLATVRRNMKELLPAPKDKHWSTASMLDYPIAAEALPSILELWIWMRENLNKHLTIREAQWAARFYAITKEIPHLALMSRGHALVEVVSELTGNPMGDSHNVDLRLFEFMTGKEITPKREKKILGLSDEQWLTMKKMDKYIEEEDYTKFGPPTKELIDFLSYMKKVEGQGGATK